MRPQPVNGSRRYRCLVDAPYLGCGRVSIAADPLEEHIRDVVIEALEGDELDRQLAARAATDQRLRAILEEEAEVEARRQRLAHDYYVSGDLADRATFLRLDGELRDRLASLNEQARRLADRTALPADAGGDLQGWWESASLERRHALIAAVLDHIIIKPVPKGTGVFDAHRIVPVWRG